MKWTKKELKQLKKLYPRHTASEVAKIMGRSYDSVKLKASEIGVKSRRYWNTEDTNKLKKLYSKNSLRETSQLMQRSESSTRMALHRLGIKSGIRYKKSLIKLTKTQSIYLAGLIDGEGWIGIAQHNYTPNIQISNTNMKIMEYLSKLLKTKINNPPKPSEKCKQGYTVRVSSINEVEYLINKINKYLIIKHRQAQLLLEVCNMKREKNKKRLQEIWVELERLNHRGVFISCSESVSVDGIRVEPRGVEGGDPDEPG
jgi:hypothetical protein